MPDTGTETVEQLFKRWRTGDREAGQVMAQQFSDWYYAIIAARLGDKVGLQPLEAACNAFIQGIANVGRSSDLVEWAHALVVGELERAGGRVPGGDYPNALTGNRSPSELLGLARRGMDPSQARLLAMLYEMHVPTDEVIAAAEERGGMPLALLEARYALKRWLRDNAQVAFAIVPPTPNLDCGPLPLYEAGRMASAGEEAFFEKWLISELDLCRDLAEFATFAHALRAGAFQVALLNRPERSAPAGAEVPIAITRPETNIDVYDEPRRSPSWIAIGLVLVVVVALLALIVFLFFFVMP